MPGIPYLFDSNSPDCKIGVPTNTWAANLNERTNQDRYVIIGFGSLVGGSCSTNDGLSYYGGTVRGTLSSALTDICEYRVSFYAAAEQVLVPSGQPCGSFVTRQPNPSHNKIQVVLRKDNDCSNGKIVYTSPVITNSTWIKYQATFTLSPNEASLGYNHIEFRRTPNPFRTTTDPYSAGIFLDDVELIHGRSSIIDSDFTLTASNPTGSNYNYLVTATVNNVPVGSSFYWNVCEIDVLTGNEIINSCMENPSNWWDQSLWYTNSFPGYCCNPNITSGTGIFLLGHKYSITRGTWGECSSWDQTTKTVYMDTRNRSIIVEDTSFQTGGTNFSSSHTKQNYIDLFPSTELLLFPNPTNGIVSIEYPTTRDISHLDIDVFSLDGRHQLHTQINGSTGDINISDLPSGLYLFKINSGTNTITKIISLL